MLSTFNALILMLGFACVAIGYVLSNVPPERLATIFGSESISIERPTPGVSFEKSVSKISKTLLELVR